MQQRLQHLRLSEQALLQPLRLSEQALLQPSKPVFNRSGHSSSRGSGRGGRVGGGGGRGVGVCSGGGGRGWLRRTAASVDQASHLRCLHRRKRVIRNAGMSNLFFDMRDFTSNCCLCIQHIRSTTMMGHAAGDDG